MKKFLLMMIVSLVSAVSVFADSAWLLVKNNNPYYLAFYDGKTQLGSCPDGVYLLVKTRPGYHLLKVKYPDGTYYLRPCCLEKTAGNDDCTTWTLGDEMSDSNYGKDGELQVENLTSKYIGFYIDDIELGYCTGNTCLITGLDSGWHTIKIVFSDNTSKTVRKFVKVQEENQDPTYFWVTDKKK